MEDDKQGFMSAYCPHDSFFFIVRKTLYFSNVQHLGVDWI